MPAYVALKNEYEKLYATCVIAPEHAAAVAKVAAQVMLGKVRYEFACAQLLGVPWYFMGIIHMMEGNCNFNTHLHNGDSLKTRTVHVPRGRPATGTPPFTWEASAKDAMVYEGFANVSPWNLPIMLYRLETYNGWGYRHHAICSPYLWSFSNHYTKGKYTADGKYDPNAVSAQVGAAVLLKYMETNKLITL